MKTNPRAAKFEKKRDLQFLSGYQNQWVALSEDRTRVISSGKTLEEAAGKLGTKQAESAYYAWVLPPGMNYAPGSHEI